MAFGKPKAPKEPKPPKAPKEKKPKKPKKVKPPKPKKGKKGQPVPEEVEGQEGEEQVKKKKLPLPFLIISLAVIVAAAVILFLFVIKPRFFADEDPDVSVSVEPEPPVLPTEIPIGDDVSIVGLALEADESGAVAEKAKTITYTYSNLVDAGKAAQTYVGQLAGEDPSFSVVDEEFVRLKDKPDYTTPEGMVLLARNVPLPEHALRQIQDDHGRMHILCFRQRDHFLTVTSLQIGSIDDRCPPVLQPLLHRVMQELKGILGYALFIFIIAYHAPKQIGRQDLCGKKMFPCKRRFSSRARADQQDQ